MGLVQSLPTSYTVLNNQIHEIVMHEHSRRAVNMWLNHMTDLMYTVYIDGQDAYAAVLLDLREPGMMPVVYSTYAVKLWIEEYNHPPAIDLAIVYRYGLLGSLATPLARLSRLPDGVRLFHKGRYDDALGWLQQRVALMNPAHRN